MIINQYTGLLDVASYYPSPNYNLRPKNCVIDLLVIHNISLPEGQFGGDAVIDLFMNRLDCNSHPEFASLKNLEVSSHLFIRRTGEIIQFVPFQERAWHAGVSSFEGRENCNDYSVGIELEGTDTIPYTETQYQQLLGVIPQLQKNYPGITRQRIVGHSDIAPGRKTDPGPAFEWKRLDEIQ